MQETVLCLTNQCLSVALEAETGALSVLDRRNGQVWRQRPVRPAVQMRDMRMDADRILATWHDAGAGLNLAIAVWLDGDRAEVCLTIDAQGPMAAPVRFPHPFVAEKDDFWLVVPMNEGIAYPVDDDSIEPMRLIAYGGHGICMAFWGLTDGERAQMTIIEDGPVVNGAQGQAQVATRSSDDAAIRIDRLDGRLCIAPEWDAQRGQFGYQRALRYVFFEQGDHVAMAKRYRAYAADHGRLKTLAAKRQENPNVDLLIGAPNVWCWDKPATPFVIEMQMRGLQRALWSDCRQAREIDELNALGALTSTYDMYQDVMDPAQYPTLRFRHGRWPAAAWPEDLMIDSKGDWVRGWGIETIAGDAMVPCGVVCDQQAPPYAAERVNKELTDLHYTCRFIDTTTATPWRECYHPNHPMTRSDSRHWKMVLLDQIAGAGLVLGTETGHDAAVPFAHYFEGMLSLGKYRIPDAGRQMSKIWNDVPERVARYQMGASYRLPLWELVFHDCVVSHWYWGDYNNKLPALWDKRDLFNILYGTAPMYMFDQALWLHEQARFVRSYSRICPMARAVGYAEMLGHRHLTPDRQVQQTTFANGVTVTVNFGDKPFGLSDARSLSAMDYDVGCPAGLSLEEMQ